MSTAGKSRDAKLYFYDSVADCFDRIANPYDLHRRLEVVFDELLEGHDLRGRRVLDVGSGTGWFSQSAIQRGADVVSLDIGPRLLAQTRARCSSLPVAADACQLPFAPSTFDTVVSSECIEHTLQPLRAVREMARVLVAGGTLVLTTPNPLWRWSATLASKLKLRPYQGYEHWVSPREVRREMSSGGLRVDVVKGFHLVPPFIRGTWPVLRLIDRHGQLVSGAMLNFAIKATKL